MQKQTTPKPEIPGPQGLYSPTFEHDACGIGMLVNVKGEKSHALVCDAVRVLQNLTHRGGAGCEAETGDGAGILLQLPHAFFARTARAEGFTLPAEGAYGVAMLFLSPDAAICEVGLARFCGIAGAEGLRVLGTRQVPTCAAGIGKTAAEVCPSIRQVFLARPAGLDATAFERKLYVLAKLAARAIRYAPEGADPYFYVASLSAATIVYKGMLLPGQLAGFYLDLQDEAVASAIVLVHSRFSTNTFPSWERAHPMQHIIHNGEINTIRGNVNWMRARQNRLQSEALGEDLPRILPIIDEDGSDSAMLDDFIKLLVHAGTPLAEAVMLAIPQPWEHDDRMDAAKRAFYEYNACRCEAWDGPAAVAFTDGRVAGATLDRNGLRPARYTLTKSGTLILASETGVLDIPAGEIVEKNRLRPGHMLLVDTVAGRIIDDAELKATAAKRRPYVAWLQTGLLRLDSLPTGGEGEGHTLRDIAAALMVGGESAGRQALLREMRRITDTADNTAEPLPLGTAQRLFGYTHEDLDLLLAPMAETGEDPVASMGYDAPPAALSGQNQLLYNYFKQLFAQVTNPPIDAIREKLVTSSAIQLGAEGNLLLADESACRVIHHSGPVLGAEDMARLRGLTAGPIRCATLPMLFRAEGGETLEAALDDLCLAADASIEAGYNILVLSDRAASAARLPIPALLALAGVHHHLIRKGSRTRTSLVVETGEAREVHHLALLVGYGANAVHPYTALQSVAALAAQGRVALPPQKAVTNYQKAATKSIVKVMSKMGISTLRSYHGAQVFEALGISEAVVERYFTGTPTRIGGVTLSGIEAASRGRCAGAFSPPLPGEALPAGGCHKWRRGGEAHLYTPESIFYLQQSARSGDYALFKRFTACVDGSTGAHSLRGLLEVVEAAKPIPLDRVEPVESILRRFKTGAMSYGSISGEAHETMAVAMNRLGGKSNSGEGGENPGRFVPDENGDSRCSAIKQVASGRFGVTLHYLNNAVEIQIKMAQGAKPGEGGHLPGKKVYPWIAKARHATPGVELISPPPHHDIYSIEDLAQLIHDLKCANPSARVSVKLVSEAGVGTVAVGVAKGLADVIVVSGYDGGTGAAPRTSIRHAGLPWELGLAETHQTLLLNGLRDRVVLETDGKLLCGRDVLVAALLGAEEFAFATAPLVAMGCDMMRVCNLDTCPVGIATQDPALRARFTARPEYIENLMRFIAQEVREWLARIGKRSLGEVVGHTELLRETAAAGVAGIDLSRLLHQPAGAGTGGGGLSHTRLQNGRQAPVQGDMDTVTLVPLCRPAIEEGHPVEYHLPIRNTNRTVGCGLSGAIVRRHGAQGLADGSIRLCFRGSAGQSFGAFLTRGVELRLTGDANDTVGKGLSGGRIILTPLPNAAYPQEDIIAGNVALYGATAGEVYICGSVGERFAVRNSGATAVVEGVGDHGCEYMTGGVVAVLGPVGRNFAAGMSGGVAYVYDPHGTLPALCNREKNLLATPGESDRQALRCLLEKHLAYTGSKKAAALLADFETSAGAFVKVAAPEYLAALQEAGTGQPSTKSAS